MKLEFSLKTKNRKYTFLLINLILCFFLSAIFDSIFSRILLNIAFLNANFWTIDNLDLSPRKLWFIKLTAGIGVLLSLPYLWVVNSLTKELFIVGFAFDFIFLSLAILLISQRVMGVEKVDNDIIIGGICIYLLIGFIWFILYRIIVVLAPHAFNHVMVNNITLEQKLMYFSFTTLTTLGYGDITPATELAMALTNAEAMIGQLFPAIFIARLVNLHSGNEDK